MTSPNDWFQTPPGAYALDWERAQFDQALADVFGYHALQLGLPAIDALASNRMPHRWLAHMGPMTAQTPTAAADEGEAAAQNSAAPSRVALLADSTALPFAEASLDLVVMPHTLEFSADPHASLREVQRVLVHEGKLVITGFNPASLWGLRQWRARLYGGGDSLYLPDAGELISHWRLRDWLRLLQFELQSVAYGCYRPAVRSQRRLARFAWMDRAGARWWSVFGAVYVMVAVKRSPGPLLLGTRWHSAPAAASAPVSVAGRATPTSSSSSTP